MITVHVGYPKAGSTTLQKHLFHGHPEIVSLGSYPTGNIGRDSRPADSARFLRDDSLKHLHEMLTSNMPESYDFDTALRIFQEAMSRYADPSDSVVFSNERLLSVIFSFPDLEAKANRLKQLCPEARILIVLRNQLDVIVSQYRDWPFSPLNLTAGPPVSIAQWIDAVLEHDDDLRYIHSLKYDRIIELYRDLFGKEAVTVLCLETLAEDVEHFSWQISELLGVDFPITAQLLQFSHENQGVTYLRNAYRRLKRRRPRLQTLESYLPVTMKRALEWILNTGEKASYAIPADQEKKLRRVFATPNQRTDGLADVPLANYGYPGLES